MRLIVILLLLGFTICSWSKDLLSSSAWPNDGSSFPGDWIAFTYRGASKITLLPNKIARISSQNLGSGYIGKRASCKLPAGTVVKVSGRYRTLNMQFAAKGFIRVNVNFNEKSPSKERRFIGQNLKISEKWQNFSIEKLLDIPIDNFFAFFQMYNATGEVEFTDLAITVLDKNNNSTPSLIIWREAEKSMRGGSLSKHGRNIPNYYSGEGGYYIENGKLTYQFKIESEVDKRSLLPIKRKYYIWGRVYGYKDCPQVKVFFNRKEIYSFLTQNKEKLVNKVYQGEYYWQRLGSFEAIGGAYELGLKSQGRMFVDALIFTDNPSYQPQKFEGRKQKQSQLFTDLTLPVMVNPVYRTNSISVDVVSPICLNLVTPGNKPVIQKGTLLVKIPKGVLIKNVSSHWAGRTWKAHSQVPDVLRVKITDDADGGLLCKINLSYLSLRVILYLQADTSLKTSTALKYSLDTASGKQPWESLPLQVVSIPKAVSFKKIRVGVAGQNFQGFYSDYPNLFELCRHVGINLLNPWHLYPKLYPKTWQEFSQKAKQHDIKIYGEYSPRLGKIPHEDLAVRIDGTTDNHPTILPNPKSAWFKKDLDKIAELARYVDTIVFDDENTNYAKDRIDYSLAVLKKFSEYRKQRNLPPLTIPVSEIVKKKKIYAKEYAQWVDFKCEMISLHYNFYLKAARRYNPKAEIIPQIIKDVNPKALRENSFWDYKKLLQYTKRISPMVYTYQGICDSGVVGDTMKLSNQEVGKFVTVPTLLVEHPGSGQILPSEKPMYKYQLWESLMEKADVILYWDATAFFNPINLQYISEGIRIASAYEQFFLKGIPVKVKSPAWIRVKALQLKNQLLLYVANYQNVKNKTSNIILPNGQSFKVNFNKDIARFYVINLK